jgi:hypothetical protein
MVRDCLPGCQDRALPRPLQWAYLLEAYNRTNIRMNLLYFMDLRRSLQPC